MFSLKSMEPSSFPGVVSESVYLRGGYHEARSMDNILSSDRQASLSYFKNEPREAFTDLLGCILLASSCKSEQVTVK